MTFKIHLLGGKDFPYLVFKKHTQMFLSITYSSIQYCSLRNVVSRNAELFDDMQCNRMPPTAMNLDCWSNQPYSGPSSSVG